jgi:hypothetical protein
MHTLIEKFVSHKNIDQSEFFGLAHLLIQFNRIFIIYEKLNSNSLIAIPLFLECAEKMSNIKFCDLNGMLDLSPIVKYEQTCCVLKASSRFLVNQIIRKGNIEKPSLSIPTPDEAFTFRFDADIFNLSIRLECIEISLDDKSHRHSSHIIDVWYFIRNILSHPAIRAVKSVNIRINARFFGHLRCR